MLLYLDQPGNEIYLIKGSAQQLLLDNQFFTEGSITPWLTIGMSVFAINDALAQAIGAIQAHWNDDFKQKVMVYIGPGTGLGGAILKLGTTPSKFEIITDGHIYDLLL